MERQTSLLLGFSTQRDRQALPSHISLQVILTKALRVKQLQCRKRSAAQKKARKTSKSGNTMVFLPEKQIIYQIDRHDIGKKCRNDRSQILLGRDKKPEQNSEKRQPYHI
ncbi:hypothetical protein [Acetobacter thailandicus]|uniref:hypothetical protein n=1 Tax=Acetobacter thailandicus TaxID=1502842 RepID=UPI00156A47D8|nr:hypothetical protein [Acetobacter thailandicus]NHN95145.1 hypothetical protein [Acetobacter thailandicus]